MSKTRGRTPARGGKKDKTCRELPTAGESHAVPFFQTAGGMRVLETNTKVTGLVACIWKQGMPHGNKRYEAQSDICLPVLHQKDVNYEHNWKQMWSDFGVVATCLDEHPKVQQSLTAQFLKDMKTLGLPRGPCARLGLLTGGGLPYCKFARDARSLMSFQQLWRDVYTFDGRGPPAAFGDPVTLSMSMMEESLAAVPMRCSTYVGLPSHTDNNMVEGCAEIFHLQGSVTLSPPPQGWGRVAALMAMQFQTHFQYRQSLLGLSTRSGRCEWGCVGKGPLDRPSPHFIFRGSTLKVSEAEAMANEDLHAWIKNKTDKSIKDLVTEPMQIWGLTYQGAEKKLMKCMALELGGAPLTEAKALKKAFRLRGVQGLRHVIMRAVLGGKLTDAEIYEATRQGIPLASARRVCIHFKQTWDKKVIFLWCGNSGRHGRTSSGLHLQSGKSRATSEVQKLKIQHRNKNMSTIPASEIQKLAIAKKRKEKISQETKLAIAKKRKA